MELMQAHTQWANRPADERFVSLLAMNEKFQSQRKLSRELVVANRRLTAMPDQDNQGLVLQGPGGAMAAPSNWAFGQLCGLAEAPAGYMRSLPSPIVADCLNWGLQYKRSVEEVGVLLYKNGEVECRALTGPKYGRVWNGDICQGLVNRFGNGVSDCEWRVPGEWGKAVPVTADNTTLFAGDRDMFVFLCDEQNQIEIPDRRNGQSGSMARGFFVWNSEVGARTLGIATFLFDFVCGNRIVWGAKQYKQVTIRHTSGAPVRFLEEVLPALKDMSSSGTRGIVELIAKAKEARLDKAGDSASEWLAKRFGKRLAACMDQAHGEEEGKPIETLWDASVGLTAFARSKIWQDERVDLEREAGKLLDLVA